MGSSLLDALTTQYDGSWKRSHFKSSAYNELVVSSMEWERCLPACLEAFVIVLEGERTEEQATVLAATRRTRESFLAEYGLYSEEVPLLRYVCSQWGASRCDELSQKRVPTATSGACFEDITSADDTTSPESHAERS